MPAAELKHGPIALVDENMPVIVLSTQSLVLDKVRSNVEEPRARGARIIAITGEDDEALATLAHTRLTVPRLHDAVMPLVAVVPLQLLAYHVACERGCDVDRPRNLAKRVTEE